MTNDETEGICKTCRGTGVIEIKCCPYRFVTDDVRMVLLAAEHAKHGMWPVAGGWLDQTQLCLDALRMIKCEENELAQR